MSAGGDASGRLIHVALPRAVCGLLVREGRVVECAPYLRRHVLGRPEAEAARILRAMGATLTPLDPKEE